MILLLFFFSALMASPQERRPIIAIGGIMHESDTFNPAQTELSDFAPRRTTPRAEALAEWARSNDEVSGYIEGGREHGLELVPVLMASATRSPQTCMPAWLLGCNGRRLRQWIEP